MKTNHVLRILALLLLAISATAQQGINYKAIINDTDGIVLANAAITVQFTILADGTTPAYKETHSSTTDANGIIIVNIGEGTPVSGNFNSIDWGGNPHFLKTEIDKGFGLTDMGTTEFKAVPYAIYAKTVDSSLDINFINSVKRGDWVKTIGGIIGKIESVTEYEVTLEIADNVICRVDKMAIRRTTD